MAALVQLLLAVLVGGAAWGLSVLLGIPDPWPIIIGVIACLLVLGFCVFMVDSDLFD